MERMNNRENVRGMSENENRLRHGASMQPRDIVAFIFAEQNFFEGRP